MQEHCQLQYTQWIESVGRTTISCYGLLFAAVFERNALGGLTVIPNAWFGPGR
jgi:hypothetical protein